MMTINKNLANIYHHSLVIGIVAGEVSGTALGADFMKKMNALRDDIIWVGVGGRAMQDQGLISVFELERLAVMGLVEVLKHLKDLFKARSELLDAFDKFAINWFIGIDAPDFNLRVAKKLKPKGVFCVQYVSPSIWAWRESRIHNIKKSTHLVLCLFPFELKVYQRHNHPAVCVGHPLIHNLPSSLLNTPIEKQRRDLIWKNETLLNFFNARQTEISQLICVMPGSRNSEIKAILPPMLNAVKRLLQFDSSLCFVIPTVSKSHKKIISDMVSKQDQAVMDAIAIVHDEKQNTPFFSQSIIAICDIIVLASGTATLEAMLITRPMVVVYRLNKLTYTMINYLIKSAFVSLPNILANAAIVPELIQDEATGDNICYQVRLLMQPEPFENQLDALMQTTQKLRQQSQQSPVHAVIDAWCDPK